MSETYESQTLPLLRVNDRITIRAFEDIPSVKALVTGVDLENQCLTCIGEIPASDDKLYFELYEKQIDDLVIK